MIKPKVRIIDKSTRQRKEQHYHYPSCPTCGNREYEHLDACVACTKLVCNVCKGTHEYQ